MSSHSARVRSVASQAHDPRRNERGMALIYAATGSMTFASLAGVEHSGLVAAGIAMILIAIAFKLSLVPFHLWTPDVYHGAPAPVGAFLATVSKIAVVVVLWRWWQAAELGSDPVYSNLMAALAATDHWSSFELLATASPEVTCTEKGESGKASRAAPSISRQTCRSVDPACVAMYETLYSPGTVSDHSPL
jgi:hypothetical protein